MNKLKRKFYIVENKEFFERLAECKELRTKMRTFREDFFRRHGVEGRASVFLNKEVNGSEYLSEENRDCITMAIEETQENISKFKDQIQDIRKNMAYMNTDSALLSEYKKEIEENRLPLYVPGIYSLLQEYIAELNSPKLVFEHFYMYGKLYIAFTSFTYGEAPKDPDKGFVEIKGSEYFKALEAYEATGGELSWLFTFHKIPEDFTDK